MELTFECPRCDQVDRVRDIERAASIACPRCEFRRDLNPQTFDDAGLRLCACCATEDLYIQKDFPHNLGLLIVIVGFAASSVFWYRMEPVAAFGVLLSTAALDVFLYYRVPDVTLCYRCLAQHRGEGANPGGRFRGFDLGVGERYRQERIRVEELREKAKASGSGPIGSTKP